MHHNPCFNLLILHNNSVDSQGSEIIKNILLRFDILSFTKTFFPLPDHSGEHWWEESIFCSFTTSILVKLSTCCFELSGDISYSLLVNPSHTDESWAGRNTCMWISTLSIHSLSTLKNTDENKIFFVRSPQAFWLSSTPGVLALWWHQLFPTR